MRDLGTLLDIAVKSETWAVQLQIWTKLYFLLIYT